MELLEDAVDSHVHSAPDVVDRKRSDLELARAAVDAGMAGVVIKNHVAPTAGRVAIVNEAVGEEVLYGSVCLNGAVGGLNPDAVDATLRMGGRVVWLPTMWSRQNARRAWEAGETVVRGQRAPRPGEELTVLDAGGLLPAVDRIVELVAEHDAALATGHLDWEETVAVAERSQERGATCLVTHAFSDYLEAGVDDQRMLVDRGAFLEYCAITLRHDNDVRAADVAEAIDHFGADRCVLSSDFGQTGNPDPAPGLAAFAEGLVEAGLSEAQVRTSLTTTPRRVLGIE